MRPFHLAIADLIAGLGGPERVARRIGVSEGHVYKYGQNPEVSGKDIPVRHLMDLVAETTAQPIVLGAIARELIDHFAKRAGQALRSDDPLEELRYVAALLERRAGITAQVSRNCPTCRKVLHLDSVVNGVPYFTCGEKHNEWRSV